MDRAIEEGPVENRGGRLLGYGDPFDHLKQLSIQPQIPLAL